MRSALLFAALLAGCEALVPRGAAAAAARPAAARPRGPALVMREYSSLVKMTVESRSPFRQARMFFLYPPTIAGASVAFYVALTRVIAALSGARQSPSGSRRVFCGPYCGSAAVAWPDVH